MFKAVIEGKSGKIRYDIKSNESETSRIGLDVPSIREDVLSAAIFSRLSYLPANKFWNLLCRIHDGLPKRECVKLKNIEFWPKWTHPKTERIFTEPDIFIQFEIGEPKESVDLIVEAKRFDSWTPQSAEQHLDQITSYFADEGIDRGRSLHFLALGGLGNESQIQISGLIEDVIDKLSDSEKSKFSPSHIAGASWKELAIALDKCRSQWQDLNNYLMDDLIEILAHAGFKKRDYFSELPAFKDLSFDYDGLNKMYKRDEENGG